MITIQCRIENASQKYSFNFSNEQVKNFLEQDPKFKENLNEREKDHS